LPVCTLALALAFQVQPADPGKPGMPGAPRPGAPLAPIQPVSPPPQPSRTGPPTWLLTQLPLWIVLILAAQRHRQEQAARLKMRHEEEEHRTPYTEEDLMQDVEFKIVRNELNLFEQPHLLAEVLREESQAGWQLVEKFDGNRVRLKRPASGRAGDAALPSGVDPYRTEVLVEITRKWRSDRRARDLRIAGTVLAVGASLSVLLGFGAASAEGGWRVALIGGAVVTGIAACVGAVVLVVRFFTK
jgi:hypothetical protein